MCPCEYMRVCSENKGSDPFLLGEEGSHIPDKDADMETESRVAITARSSCAGFLVMAMIAGASW